VPPRLIDKNAGMLVNGFNHVAILTSDTDRFVRFYRDIFDAEVFGELPIGPSGEMGKLTLIRIGE
jgi:predicted enzyme related to lactoylglutathione lyase